MKLGWLTSKTTQAIPEKSRGYRQSKILTFVVSMHAAIVLLQDLLSSFASNLRSESRRGYHQFRCCSLGTTSAPTKPENTEGRIAASYIQLAHSRSAVCDRAVKGMGFSVVAV
jgi:hypothetical protein